MLFLNSYDYREGVESGKNGTTRKILRLKGKIKKLGHWRNGKWA